LDKGIALELERIAKHLGVAGMDERLEREEQRAMRLGDRWRGRNLVREWAGVLRTAFESKGVNWVKKLSGCRASGECQRPGNGR